MMSPLLFNPATSTAHETLLLLRPTPYVDDMCVASQEEQARNWRLFIGAYGTYPGGLTRASWIL